MPEKVRELRHPSGWSRWFFRFPIKLYQANLGWLLGKRLLYMIHIGRKSGKPRQVVLEVVDHDPETDTYYVASGWGEKSDWLRNIEKTPQVYVKTGWRHFPAAAKRLTGEEAEEALLNYNRRHPHSLQPLARYMGYRLENTEQDIRLLAHEIPLVAIKPESKLHERKVTY